MHACTCDESDGCSAAVHVCRVRQGRGPGRRFPLLGPPSSPRLIALVSRPSRVRIQESGWSQIRETGINDPGTEDACLQFSSSNVCPNTIRGTIISAPRLNLMIESQMKFPIPFPCPSKERHVKYKDPASKYLRRK